MCLLNCPTKEIFVAEASLLVDLSPEIATEALLLGLSHEEMAEATYCRK